MLPIGKATAWAKSHPSFWQRADTLQQYGPGSNGARRTGTERASATQPRPGALWLLSLWMWKGKVSRKVEREAREPRFGGEKCHWGHTPGRSEKYVRILEGKIAGLLQVRWWICGVSSIFWHYNVCLIPFVCGDFGSIMNTLYHVEWRRHKTC
jgi:hypothetical protein